MDKNKSRREIVMQHAQTDRNACNTLTRFVVQREIVGSGGCRGCWLVLTQYKTGRDAMDPTVRCEVGRRMFEQWQ